MRKISVFVCLMFALFCNAQNLNFDTNADGKVSIIDVCNTIHEAIEKQNTEDINTLITKIDNTVDIAFGIVPRSPIFEDIDVNGVTYHLGISGAIDLGLESGTKWASYNVGATSPIEYGDYYAWGETEPYYTEENAQDNPCSSWRVGKTGYNWSSYFDSVNGSETNFKKYAVDKTTELDPGDDVAHVKWQGNWRIPTQSEIDELSKLTSVIKKYGEVKVRIILGKNGNAIILPYSGFRNGTNISLLNKSGNYMSNMIGNTSKLAYIFHFGSSFLGENDGIRCNGMSVRPVCGGSASHDGGEDAN